MSWHPLKHPPEWKLVVGRAFLLGVPVIGPQVAVYESLCAQLAGRPPECWHAWGTDRRRVDLARFMARALGDVCGWPNPVFLPEDPIELVAWSQDDVDFDVEEACMRIEEHLGIGADAAAREHMMGRSFGEAVDHLLGQASQGSHEALQPPPGRHG